MAFLPKTLFINLFLICLFLASPVLVYAVDLCEGYASSDTQKQNLLAGTCYYLENTGTSFTYTTQGPASACPAHMPDAQCSNLLPSCPTMTKGSTSVSISDEQKNCQAGPFGKFKCCASASLTPIPPNPCPDQNGVCTIIDTAVGTIDVSTPGAFVKVAFGVILSISGAIAILIIVFAGYGIMTSQGDPEKIKGAQEQLTSAIIGLLFMIFSVTILHIIGVDIFHLPGFLQ